MIATVAPIAALLFSVALLLMGNGLQGTLLPVRANIEAFSQIDIGVMGSVYFLGFAIGCYSGPYLVKRVGHIRTFAAMVALASSVVLVHSLVIEAISWWVMRGLTGLCFAVLYLVIESWLNATSTNANRGLVFSIYTVITLTVITAGQMLLIADSPQNFSLFAIASVLISLAAVPVALTTAQAPPPAATVKIRLGRLYRLSPVGVMGCLAVGLANGAFWSLAPVFAQERLGGVENIAIFMSVVVIAGAAGQWPLGWMSDRIDRRKVITTASIGAALAGAALSLFGGAYPDATMPLAFGFGFFALPIYALSVAHMNDFVHAEDYVEAAGGLLLVFAAGAVLGPILASVVIEQAGVVHLFLYTAAVHVLIGGFAFYRMFKRQRAPDDEQVAFADSLRVAQTVSNIEELSPDPHTEEDPSEPAGQARPQDDADRPDSVGNLDAPDETAPPSKPEG